MAFVWFSTFLARWRSSRVLILIIVFVALFLDTLLVSCVAPIIPDYLYRIEHPKHNCSQQQNKMHMSDRTCSIIIKVDTSASTTHQLQTMKQSAKFRQDLTEENGRMGILFASKAFVQLFTNPFVGILVARFGYTPPLLFGFAVMFASTCGFAFSNTYATLFVSRAVQGVGSAFTAVTGFSLLASHYVDDVERGVAIGRVTSGVSLGAALGPFLGGFLYYQFGKTVTFLSLAIIALIDGLLRLSMTGGPTTAGKSMEHGGDKINVSIITLLRDPYVLLLNGAVLIGLIGGAILDTTIPIHMMVEMGSPTYLQGMVFLPFAIAMGVSQITFGYLAVRMGRWLCSLLGMLLMAVGLFFIPQIRVFYILLIPMAIIGMAIGMIIVSIAGLLTEIVDYRYTYACGYTNIFCIFDMTLCLSFIIGPAISGYLLRVIGFSWLFYSMALLNIIYAPLLLILRNLPPKLVQTSNEHQALISTSESVQRQ